MDFHGHHSPGSEVLFHFDVLGIIVKVYLWQRSQQVHLWRMLMHGSRTDLRSSEVHLIFHVLWLHTSGLAPFLGTKAVGVRPWTFRFGVFSTCAATSLGSEQAET